MIRSDSPAGQHEVEGAAGITSNFSREGYLHAVQRAIDYIRAGDVFQVNLSQRLLCPAQQESAALYQRLRKCNPAPFAGYFDAGAFQILSASPERFLCVRGREVETRPIKGTRPRTGERAPGPPRRSRTIGQRKRSGRKRDDRRPAAKRPFPCVLARKRASQPTLPDRGLSARVAPCLGGARSTARRVLAVRLAARGVSGRLGHRCAENPARWRSSPNWSRRSAARIAVRWATGVSTARWISTFSFARSSPAAVAGGFPWAAAWWRNPCPNANTKKPGTKPRACCEQCNARDSADRQLRQLRLQSRPILRAARTGALRVVRNTAVDPADVRSLRPAAIVFSPGPCALDRAGCSLEVVRQLHAEIPMLGICLGHQAIAQAFGGASSARANRCTGAPLRSITTAAGCLPACLARSAAADTIRWWRRKRRCQAVLRRWRVPRTAH